MANLIDRITIDPAICHGKPCVRGLRYRVEVIPALLSAGITVDDVLADEDILAVLAFAARLAGVKRLQPAGGWLSASMPDVRLDGAGGGRASSGPR